MPELVHVSPAFHRFLVDRNRDDETLVDTLHRLSDDAAPEDGPGEPRQPTGPSPEQFADGRATDAESRRHSD